MNQQQTKYVLTRIDAIVSTKFRKIKEEFPDFRLSREERFKALKEGRFKVVGELPPERYYGSEIDSWISFEEDINRHEIRREKEKVVETEAQKLRDQVMLGEDEGLLAALQEFDNKDF